MSPAGTRRNGTRKFGTAVIGRLLGPGSPRPGEQPEGQEGHLPRHGAPKAASRKRAGKLVTSVAVGATLAGAAAYGVATTSTTHDASLDAMMTASAASRPVSGSGALVGPVGHVDSLAASLSRSQHAIVRHPSPSRSRKPSASRASASRASASRASARKAAASRHAPAARATASAKPVAFTLSCGTSGLLPANVTTIVSFLLAHGYSHNAAAGIAGNIYQESKGNPESAGMGGGGLIGFTPLPASYVTGNVAADLQTQLKAILAFNQQWAGYLPTLNDAATPAAAADVYVTKFERAGIPAAGTREAAAQDVASACYLGG